MTVLAFIEPDRLRLAVQYQRTPSRRAAPWAIATRYGRIVRRLAADPGLRVGTVDVLDDAERHRLLVELNDTAAAVPEATLTDLFEHQAVTTPAGLVTGDVTLTYRELNSRANRLAAELIRRHVGPYGGGSRSHDPGGPGDRAPRGPEGRRRTPAAGTSPHRPRITAP